MKEMGKRLKAVNGENETGRVVICVNRERTRMRVGAEIVSEEVKTVVVVGRF